MPLQHTQRTINSDRKTKPVTVPVDTAAYALSPYDSLVFISSTAATDKVITPTDTNFVSGPVTIRMTARVAGKYTMAVDGGSITWDAAGETATVISHPQDAPTAGTWTLVSLQGATFA